MRPRFILDVATIVAAAALVAVSMALVSITTHWIAFGVFTAVLVAMVAALASTQRVDARIGHALGGAAALWGLVAALIFTGTGLMWWVFANAIALGVLAVADLVAHEFSTERVVHSLDLRAPAVGADTRERISV